MNFLFLILPPLMAALLASIFRPYRFIVGWINASLSLISLGAALAFGAQAIAGQLPTWGLTIDNLGLADVLRVDSLSALLMVCVTAVASLTLFLSPGLGRPVKTPHW